jgi:signal transduction histidine kinase
LEQYRVPVDAAADNVDRELVGALHQEPVQEGLAGQLPAEMLSALGALARVSRALVSAENFNALVQRALAEMRDALGLELAALYLPDRAGRRTLERQVVAAGEAAPVTARPQLDFDEEAWSLAVAGGAPIVLREAATWLVANPFDPPAEHWVVLPLLAGDRQLAGVVIACSERPVALDPVGGTLLRLLGDQLSAGIATARLRQRLQEAEMERERRTLAADVHDGLAQDVAVALRELALMDSEQLDAAARLASRQRLREALTAVHRIVRSRLQELSAPPPVGGLSAAVEQVVERTRRRGLAVRVFEERTDVDVDPESIAALARILAEALANVQRHAGAREADVRLRVDGEQLLLEVADAGRGFDVERVGGVADGHLGLAIMRQRAQACGGECEIAPGRQGGTVVRVRMPVTP